MLTRWGSILKVTHSVVTMGRTGVAPLMGFHTPLARKGFGSPPMRTLNGHWRWSSVGRRSSDRPSETRLTSSFESAVGSSLPEALFDFWPPS